LNIASRTATAQLAQVLPGYLATGAAKRCRADRLGLQPLHYLQVAQVFVHYSLEVYLTKTSIGRFFFENMKKPTNHH